MIRGKFFQKTPRVVPHRHPPTHPRAAIYEDSEESSSEEEASSGQTGAATPSCMCVSCDYHASWVRVTTYTNGQNRGDRTHGMSQHADVVRRRAGKRGGGRGG
jgi:hypothetical protein